MKWLWLLLILFIGFDVSAQTEPLNRGTQSDKFHYIGDQRLHDDFDRRNQMLEPNVRFFPNPVRENLQFRFDRDVLGDVVITVFNSLGQQVYSRIVNNTYGSIDMTGVTPGVYMIRVSTGPNKDRIYKITKH